MHPGLSDVDLVNASRSYHPAAYIAADDSTFDVKCNVIDSRRLCMCVMHMKMQQELIKILQHEIIATWQKIDLWHLRDN